MMFFIRIFFYSIIFPMMICSPNINMDLTDWENAKIDDVVFQHHCLHVPATIERENDPYQIISYCLTEWPLNIQQNNLDQKFNFAQLYQQNITSQQLYYWSAPMDIIEQYQLYVNQLSISNNLSSLESKIFYNCTLPQFGPFCEYSFDIANDISLNNLSLNNIIYEYYEQQYDPINLTCYVHLECNRGTKSICLDWTEICDGLIDCQNGIDEKDCWQLEHNQCDENSYRCTNGQCISKIFLHDNFQNFECLDTTDETKVYIIQHETRFITLYGEPRFYTEDILCLDRYYKNSVKLTSSCFDKRDILMKKLLLFDTPHDMSDDCWSAVKCQLKLLSRDDPNYQRICSSQIYKTIINESCPFLISIPAGALAFGHIFFLYTKEIIESSSFWPPAPEYICYNDQLCDKFYSTDSLISFNNATCRRPQDFPLTFKSRIITKTIWYYMYVEPIYEQLQQCNQPDKNNSRYCNNLTMYKCINSSKCISKNRLCDGIYDCISKDDEQCSPIKNSCQLYGLDNLFKCDTINQCISSSLVNDGNCRCIADEYDFCNDEQFDARYIKKHISFPTICDGFTELIPVNIDGRNETDETECQYWQCNNTYTRCDGFWNCYNGADEVDCDPSPIITCPVHHHICISSKTNQFICLSLNKTNDDIIDCLGGTDEPKLCRSNTYKISNNNFFCMNYTNGVCTSFPQICHQDICYDEQINDLFCNNMGNMTFPYYICYEEFQTTRSTIENFFCARQPDSLKTQLVYFTLERSINSLKQSSEISTDEVITSPSIQAQIWFQYEQQCHRGLPLRIRSNGNENLTNMICLCPPSFYGNQCQYQNQRVSLTMRFQAYSDSRQTLFVIIISLIDHSDQRIIHSYQQITYLYTQHCQTKFNMYLLYANRPKLLTMNYSIHIDIYEKISQIYRGSLLILLNYSFLPVHRIAVQLNIPRTTDEKKSCSDTNCIHGQCILYTDDPNETSFCKCDQGWSGKYCTIVHTCTCAPGSLCIGISANNRSICVCPINKWGSKCLLNKTICNVDENSTCKNNGQCIPLDEHLIFNQQFLCLCRKGFSGTYCEKEDNKIIISFHDNIKLPHTILVHFIKINDDNLPINGSTFKTLSIDQKPVTIYWSYPFHIVFVELFNDSYYLVHVQKTYNQSSVINKTINPSDRCTHINEMLNETIVNYHLLRRIKYYHIPCQKYSPLLSCFYDDTHFCLCNNFGNQRLANCLEFNSTIKHDCFGQSDCEHDAQCIQDRSQCPQTSMCICPKCYYGTRCQFTSNLFTLSLDGILGYHIQPQINLSLQPSIVQVSVVLATILILIGLINSILSLITFKNKQTQIVGCGFYLLGSSIMGLLIVIIFTFKFSILLITQMTYVTNEIFLRIQCCSIDFLLHICFLMDQWLSACIAMERIFTVIKGIKFNKTKSKKMAKLIISFLICLTTTTTIHDPIHRRLFYENDINLEENRIWCIVSYSNHLQIYNKFIEIFHFIIPFIINIISAIIIIIMTARQRMILHPHETYQNLLYEQFQQHKNLLVAPIILIILAIPRLIIALVEGCMKSTRDSWLFLIGYFISFVPSMLTFVVFVLSSTSYKEIFRNTMKNYRQTIQRWFTYRS